MMCAHFQKSTNTMLANIDISTPLPVNILQYTSIIVPSTAKLQLMEKISNAFTFFVRCERYQINTKDIYRTNQYITTISQLLLLTILQYSYYNIDH